MRIAVLGGTGDEGLGLAMRFAASGHEVTIGSRSQERAHAAALQVVAVVAAATVTGAENAEAAAWAEVVFISVPYAAQRPTLGPLAKVLDGKLVVTVVVPLVFGKGGPQAEAVPDGSAALEAQELLPGARVTSAFQNLSAHQLQDLGSPVDCDVVVCGTERESRQIVLELAAGIPGVRGVDGGPLSYSRYVEDLTALLLALNRRYKTETGIRITGIT